MTGAELLTECRTRLRDTTVPYFWSDSAIMSYLNKAEQVFAELTYILVDTDTYVAVVPSGEAKVELDPEILHVFAAQEDSGGVVLRRLNAGNLRLLYASATGTPRYFFTASSKPLVLGVYPKADADYTLNMVVAIKPSATFGVNDEPQIPTEYHLDLVHYVMGVCLNQPDTDAYDPQLANTHEDAWAIALRDAKRDVFRIQYGPNTVANVPNWTGGK